MYYAQGFHIAFYDSPLFDDPIQAWEHGPVVPALYHEYKQYGAGAIPKPANVDFARYGEDVTSLLDDVYKVFGQYSAWKLRNMTHEEPPWRNAYDRFPGSEITHADMRDYFSTLTVDG